MIRLVCVGKIKEKALATLIGEYVKRISGYTKIEIVEVPDEPNDKLPDATVKEIEGQRILKQIKKDSFVILLDLRGKQLTSIQFAQKLEEIQTYHSSQITFVIGGSLGVSEEVFQRSELKLQLSEMTFPHNLARLIVLEQIYRGYKILNHEAYHK